MTLFPSGYRAVYRGRLYKSNAGLPGGVTLFDGPDGEVATVPIEDLDEWYNIRTVGTYLDEPFKVEGESDDKYTIVFIGSNGHKIADEWKARANDERAQYWQEDRYTFIATVPKDEVHDVHEERRDVLARWRAAQEKR